MTKTNDLAEAIIMERTFDAPVATSLEGIHRCGSNAAVVFRSKGIQAGDRL